MNKLFILLELAERRRRGIVWERMNKNSLLCLISIILVTSCTDSRDTHAVATPTPENYGLYTDLDLQIYSETIDLKIREALKNNNPSQAQELARKRQELIAEFIRRGLTRKPAGSASKPAESSRPTPQASHPRTRKQPTTGLPGQDYSTGD
jgi:hypothetical protein